MRFPLLFDISGGELIIILLVVLLFFGSKGIPDIARTMGRAMRQVRDASDEVRREIHKGASDVRRTVEMERKAFLEAAAEDPPKEGAAPSTPEPPGPEDASPR